MTLPMDIVACQAHTALVKIGSDWRVNQLHIKNWGSQVHKERTMSRRGLEVWRFYGDPTPLARDNIYALTLTIPVPY